MTADKSEEDLNFVYCDTDSFTNEIGEIYSYTEENEFEIYKESFKKFMAIKYGVDATWSNLTEKEKENTLLYLLNQIDDVNDAKRSNVVHCLLYISQGVFDEINTLEEQRNLSCRNCFLLYKYGAFSAAQELLIMHTNKVSESLAPTKKITSTINKDLQDLLSLMCMIVETIWRPENAVDDDERKIQKEFTTNLDQPLENGEPLSIILFSMVTKFCSHSNTKFPIKKVLLLLWKILLITLGGIKDQYELKCLKRKEADLPPLTENSFKIIQEMHASAPPTNSADLLEMAVSKRRGRIRETIEEAPKPDEDLDIHMPTEDGEEQEEGNEDEDLNEDVNDEAVFEEDDGSIEGEAVAAGVTTPMPFSMPSKAPNIAATAAKLIEIKKSAEEAEHPKIKVPYGLPWNPKARHKDVEEFIAQVRMKFIGYKLEGDYSTVAGLPNPIKDSLRVLKTHVYNSLSELQVEEESLISKYPLTKGKFETVEDTTAERLYHAMLPSLPQYMIALLKILLAAAPTSRAKTDPINILADVLPAEMPTSVVQSMKLGIDVNRHREIIVKSISAILLLLLKAFKLNHIFQFEYASQHLVFANCIPLILKFFNQNILAYVMTMNVIPIKEFPACVIGDKVELTEESLESLDSGSNVCWRNLFSSINLLRVLNKLVKWKHSRTMMLVVFKSAPILKRALKVRQAMMQVYVLKLLKLQTKYLGRAWRKNNMKIMSAIYQKVRHRLSDDWAFGNDVDARPWDFQQEECTLRASVEKFNLRRYKSSGLNSLQTNPEQAPVDNNLHSVLSNRVELPIEFKKSYDVWLEREVFTSSVKWDELLSIPYVE